MLIFGKAHSPGRALSLGEQSINFLFPYELIAKLSGAGIICPVGVTREGKKNGYRQRKLVK
jgi:hypothetical protein